MRIAGLGTLVKRFSTFVSEPIAVPYFDGKRLPFEIDDATADEDFSATAKRFLELTRRDRDLATPHVLRYTAFEAVDIWKHVHVQTIRLARRRRRDRKVYLVIIAQCADHGLQLVYREGHALSRISAIDGHLTYTDAHDLPEDEDRIM